MARTSDAQCDLSPCSSFATLDSLETEEVDIDLNHDEEHRGMSYSTSFKKPLLNLGLRSIEEGLSLLSIDEDRADRQKLEIQFDHTQCLFCKSSSIDLDQNLEHMLKKHGLFIPDRTHLIVDIETLTEYLHLIIFGYFECLYCGSQRNNVQAAQQHMIGKGHCKIDILSEDSEFKDFYDFESTSMDSDGEVFENVLGRSDVSIDERSMRLPSGKILSHRTEGKLRRHQDWTISTKSLGTPSISGPATPNISRPQPESAPSQPAPSESKKIAKGEATFRNQLATLRAGDQRSLMHLSAPQQRAIISRSRKEVEQAQRDENAMLLKLQVKSNRK